MKKLSSFVLSALLFVGTLLFITPNALAQIATNTVIVSTVPKVASGTTGYNATDWKDYWGGDGPGAGISVDVDTSAAQFKTVPTYLTSLSGDTMAGQWAITGSNSVYFPTEKGFRIYIRLDAGYGGSQISAQYAKNNHWSINWIGIEPGTQTSLPTPGKYYYLVNKNSGKVLDVQDGSTAAGGNIQQFSKTAGDNQQWVLQDAGDGYYYLVSKKSNLVAAGDDNIIQYGNFKTDDEKWKLEDAGDGYFYLVSKKTNKVLEVAGASLVDQGNVQVYTKNQTNTQKWKFEAV